MSSASASRGCSGRRGRVRRSRPTDDSGARRDGPFCCDAPEVLMRSRIPSAAVVALCAAIFGVAFGTAVARMQDRADARYRVYTAALAAAERDFVEPLDGRCNAPQVCGTEAVIYDSIDG